MAQDLSRLAQTGLTLALPGLPSRVAPQALFIKVPKLYCFGLSDLHDFDFCVFRFFVNHHLGKKYELAEGNINQTLGSLLDLGIKKLHNCKGYTQEPSQLAKSLLKAAEAEIREKVAKAGPLSFYGAQIPFLNEEILTRAELIFINYLNQLKGKLRPAIAKDTFWKYLISSDQQPLLLWGGPDAIEIGEDGVPEVVDYKYREEQASAKESMDMDLMPKAYILMTAPSLLQAGYLKARFKVRLWLEPLEESLYEEFDLTSLPFLEDFFRDKIERILRTKELSFCEKVYCKACQSQKREEWIRELVLKGWIEKNSFA